MKRITIISLLILLGGRLLFAGSLSERVYLSTDRQVYVAGDRLWVSAFCLDVSETCRFSDFSSIAYLELHSSDGLVQTAKVALVDGRGAAAIKLGADLPTGNYRLLAYTAQSKNETGYDYCAGSRVISILNTSSSARVKDGVVPVSPEEYGDAHSALPASAGAVSIAAPATAKAGAVIPLDITNAGKAASVSVSVWYDDGIAGPRNITPSDFSSSLKPGTAFTDAVVPELEGEIIRGRVVGIDPSMAGVLAGKYAFISSPGDKSDVYSSPIAEDGTLTFFTNNIYGDKDVVCEIEGLDPDVPCHIELDSPFVDADPGEIEPLRICNVMRDRLEYRGTASAIENAFASDTLYSLLPARYHVNFGNEEGIRYALDDYTRFPTMSEVIVEFIPELRARRNDDGGTDILVKLQDLYKATRYARGSTLVLLDGTPIFNQNRIMDYDPLLVESINIYPYVYYIGSRSFEGVVNMITYKRNLPSMEFDPNVRIVEYEGASLPLAYTCTNLDSSYPDYRQVALWEPVVDLDAGSSTTLGCRIPAHPGRYVVTLEGFYEDGKPVSCSSVIDVR